MQTSLIFRSHAKDRIAPSLPALGITKPSTHDVKASFNRKSFKERSNREFGGKFGYEPASGSFTQKACRDLLPDHGYSPSFHTFHLRSKYGCPKCGGHRKKTTLELREKRQSDPRRTGTARQDPLRQLKGRLSRHPAKETRDFSHRSCKHTSAASRGMSGSAPGSKRNEE